MNKLLVILATALTSSLSAGAEVTLEYCLDRADRNYPLIKKYELVEHTSDLRLSDINKSWLPRIGIYGQASLQNIVPDLPETLQKMLSQNGYYIEGLGHFQYKAGIDLTQTVWDGGTSKASREIERASANESQASLDVQMYAVREKVMNLFFGVLLIDKQIEQTENNIVLLEANYKLMESMCLNGTAMQSDVDMIAAQLLTAEQQLTSARATSNSYRRLLALYVGENLDGKKLEKPSATMPSELQSNRPELKLFDARMHTNSTHNAAVDASVMPRIGFFAQAYYGYPGINYFKSMMNRDLSFNIVGGIKVSWNIDSFYTKKNTQRRLALADECIENDRDVFLFNTNLKMQSQTDDIERLRKVMKDDESIVRLRENVRRAAESQLKNGVIDANALLSKITDENQAKLAASYHEIELLENIHKLKYTLNQ